MYNKQRRYILTSLILVFAMATCCVGVHAAAAKKKLPIYCVERQDKKVALTFDAAWGNEDTQQLIDILAEHGAKATFFVVGEWVDKYPESVKQLFDAGHDVMNHSDTHPESTKLSRDGLIAELNKCNDKIESVIGVRPNLFRPPFGDYNDAVVETVDSIGMKTIQWDVDSLDWKDLSASQIVERVTAKVQPGSIILFHNAAKHTPEALPMILDWLEDNGYEPVKVQELLLEGEYYMDHTGRQCAK